MAPVTRRSTAAGAVSKSVHRKRTTRPEHPSTEDALDVRQTSFTQLLPGYALTTTQSAKPVETHLGDLRDVAERVGREVDTFAETLDQFNDQLRGPDAFDAAYELCHAYKDYAHGMVKKLKTSHEAQRMREFRHEYGQRGQRSPTGASTNGGGFLSTTQQDAGAAGDAQGLQRLKQWQAEEDTWELFRVLLGLRYTPSSHDESRLDQLGPLHRYTPHQQVWEHFLLTNSVAKERHAVVQWLQDSAVYGDDDVDAITEELERKSGRGGGLWVNGWMETREKIKAAKRMRISSPGSDDMPTVRRSDNNELLVSALDPDAPSRQRRTLEKADASSERSLWMACWEMLRRGKPWSEVSAWLLERNQGWRALSMGVGADSSLDPGSAGPAAGSIWRRMCFAAAKDGATDKYEAAVYGLLSGDLETVQQVCQSWDDHLFAHYNALLVLQFDQYLQQNYPQKLVPSFSKRFGLSNASHHQGTAADLVRKLGQQKSTAAEACSAMKLLQASLISNTLYETCFKVGTAISDAAWLDATSAVIAPVRDAVSPESVHHLAETAISEDFDTLRIITHMLIVLREVFPPFSDEGQSTEELDNVVAAYIQLLRAAGKRDLTPIYASKMSRTRGIASLAQVISDISDPKESMEFIKLMEIYNVDAIAVLVGQYRYLLKETLADKAVDEPSLSVLETTTDELYPGQRIRLGFSSPGPSDEEVAIVNSLSVFYLIVGQWAVTFEALAYTCRRLLITGHFAGAASLVDRLQFEQLSMTKSLAVLGKAVNVMDPDQAYQFWHDGEQASQVRVLQRQAQTYYELSLLVRALEALCRWRKVESDYAAKLPRPSSVPSKVKKAFEETCAAVEPLLTGMLQEAKDDEEASDLALIRTRYLPDLVLAYNSVLCTAAHMISRDELLTAMDLSTLVANDKLGLGQAFVDAGRVRELVAAFAQTSIIMLKLNESGKPRKEKKSRLGRTLAIWEING